MAGLGAGGRGELRCGEVHGCWWSGASWWLGAWNMFKSLSRAGIPSCDDGDGSFRWHSFCRNCRVVLAGDIVALWGPRSSSPTLSRVSDSTSPSSLSPSSSAVISRDYGFRHPLSGRLHLGFLHTVTISKSSSSLDIEIHVTANRIVSRCRASG